MTTATPTAVKGLTLHVYRDASAESDHTNGGITATAARLTVVGLTVQDLGGAVTPIPDWRVSPPTEDAPPVVAVIQRRWPGTGYTVYLAPVEIDNGIIRYSSGRMYMFGGNFAATHDSRFSDALAAQLGYRPDAVRVHDRTE